jgi:hypothetical protein
MEYPRRCSLKSTNYIPILGKGWMEACVLKYFAVVKEEEFGHTGAE